ncbi:MAG: RsmG family class I SAM-dependent methyltransferase, partial [candidate division Zixibacteria bacterium]|nr:RsmG family class I SAM-dependent methyltransferase [candidate division Zixibacteria bacterium]
MMCSEPLLFINPKEILSKYNLTDKVETYFQLLKKENRNLNLVSRETIESGLVELAAESIYPLEYIQNNNIDNYLDIGSGGGFPSIPI